MALEDHLGLDKIAAKLAGLGVPALVLIVMLASTGLVGAAALTATLATLGGPAGMLGGIAVLGLLVLASKALAEYGIEALFNAVVSTLVKNGTSPEEIRKTLQKYPISAGLRKKIDDLLGGIEQSP